MKSDMKATDFLLEMCVAASGLESAILRGVENLQGTVVVATLPSCSSQDCWNGKDNRHVCSTCAVQLNRLGRTPEVTRAHSRALTVNRMICRSLGRRTIVSCH